MLGALRAGQYDEQMKRSARYSIEESYRQVRDAAEMGDVYAAWQMGEAVEWEDLADYMPQTESAREQCLFWYERAADGGIIPAMVKMGKCCQNGTYREKDEKEALRWANQCAASGEVWGLFQMGEHYRQEEDWEAAFQYDYAAAKQGSSRAMENLEICSIRMNWWSAMMKKRFTGMEKHMRQASKRRRFR